MVFVITARGLCTVPRGATSDRSVPMLVRLDLGLRFTRGGSVSDDGGSKQEDYRDCGDRAFHRPIIHLRSPCATSEMHRLTDFAPHRLVTPP
jgi:hypothetical protein